MTKTIVIASLCCVASFLIGSGAYENGQADEQQVVAAAPPQRSFVGRYQMTVGPGPIRIVDTATGKIVEAREIVGDHMEWVEIDPIAKKVTPERFAGNKNRGMGSSETTPT